MLERICKTIVFTWLVMMGVGFSMLGIYCAIWCML